MSVHRECGERIRWARNASDTKWIPPLEFSGEAYILVKNEDGEGDIATEVSTYRVHNCDPAKMVAWQEYKEKVAAIEGGQRAEAQQIRTNDWEVKRLMEQEAAWDQVHGVQCPRCDGPTDGKCINLSKAKSGGEVVYTLWPHPERVEAAGG